MRYIISILLVTVVGCTGSSTGGEGPARTLPAEIQAEGLYVHESSGMNFPSKVGDFRRTKLQRYDEAGENISASYEYRSLGGRAAVAKVSVYPQSQQRWGDLEGHFAELRGSLLDIYPDINDVAEGEIKIGQPWGPEYGKTLSFTYRDSALFKKKDCTGHLHLFSHGKWFIKYRVTYPLKNRNKAGAKVGEFMHLLTWPEQ